MAWTCPKCDRQFGAKGTGHMCQPGLTLDQFFDSSRPEAEPIFRVVNAHLETLDGELIVDPLQKKLLLKNGPTFASLDSMTKWVALGFTLRRKVASPRFSRKVSEMSGRFYHVMNLTGPEQIDGEVLEWLTEAFYKGDVPDTSGGSMVPDDIDEDFLGEWD